MTYRERRRKPRENGSVRKGKTPATGKKNQPEQGDRFRAIIEKYPQQKILVIGDFIADIYIYGKPFQLSREAPVVVIRHESEDIVPGGAGNAANNLASLGGQVFAVGILGNDDTGNSVRTHLSEKKVNVDGLLLSHIMTSTSKTRIMAGDEHTSKQQVTRVDKINKESIPSRLQEKIYECFIRLSQDVDGVVVSDYGMGVTFRRIISKLQSIAEQKVVVVDSRYQLRKFRGVTAITPNESETEMATRRRLVSNQDVTRAANALKKKLDVKAVLITRGNLGMTLLEEQTGISHIPIVGKDDITDVTGAGDTVTTVFALSLAAGATFHEAASLANYAADIVVMKSGTAVVTQQELLEAVKKNHG
jgi:rfaE bifunctional protein kinase chain/domain